MSQLFTLILGIMVIILVSMMGNVFELMLYSYAFMVSGLFVPLVAVLFFKKTNSNAAILAMIGGGLTTVILSIAIKELPFGLDANLFGISTSFILFVAGSYLLPQKQTTLKAV